MAPTLDESSESQGMRSRSAEDTAEPRGPSRWRGKLVALLLGSLVSIFLAELGIRAYERLLLANDPSQGGDVVDLAALKFNESAVSRTAPEGEFRILGFGDSFAFGPVKAPYTYYAVASRSLASIDPEQRVRIVNLGEPGISFDHYTHRYRYWSELIEHDAAVFTIYLGNDFLDIALGHDRTSLGVNQLVRDWDLDVRSGVSRRLIPRKYPLRLLDHLRARYLLWSGALQAGEIGEDDPYHAFAFHLGEEPFYDLARGQLVHFAPEDLPKLRAGYLAMVRFLRFLADLRREGLPVALLLAPAESQVNGELQAELVARYGVDFDRYDLALSSFLVEETMRRLDPELPVLDLTGSFEAGFLEGRELYYGRNTHWSVEGNELAGLSLAELLASHFFDHDLDSESDLFHLVGRPSRASQSAFWREQRQEVLDEFLIPMIHVTVSGALPAAAPELANRTRLAGPPSYGIQAINGTGVDPASAGNGEIPLPTRPDGLTIAGWAIDPASADLADGVLVEVSGAMLVASYGLPRDDVARSMDNEKLRSSGFSLVVPPDSLPSGPFEIRILVLSSDGEGVYEGEPFRVRWEDDAS